MTENQSGKILVLGDITVDVVGRLESPLLVGGDSMSAALEFHLGGVGANTALALARWRTPVRLLGSAGRDWFGEFALRALEREGVDTAFVSRPDTLPTGLIFIAVNPDGQRTIFGARGANEEVALPPDSRPWEGVAALHLVGYSLLTPSGAEAVGRLLAEARQRGLPTSLDVGCNPSRQTPQAILQAAPQLDILIAAGDEARRLTGRDDVRSACQALAAAGARQVVVKRGAEGCWLRERGEWVQVPAFSVEAADTTGAGDVFTAALLRARLRGWSWPEAAVLANAAGALTAAVVGAQAPTMARVVELLQSSRLPGQWDAARARVLEELAPELNRTGSAAIA
ncbi:MAG TPA: carbohydrate kinase family protein [Candidatus Xenobia bacterium]|nr:carbohydrate kinase family protein [Candidatus Xenobia bacterium]